MPKVIKAGATVSTGGTVQIKRYELSSKFHFGESREYDVSDLKSEEEVDEFIYERLHRLRQHLEPIAQNEVDDLFDQKAD